MKFSRSAVLILGAWVFFLGGYAAAALLLPHGVTRSTICDLLECLVPLFANTCLLWNAASPYRRRNAFWMLLALGCALWLAGELMVTYEELQLHRQVQSPFPGDILFFLHVVPWMAAVALVPHARKMRETLRYGSLDLLLLATLWLYVYIFVAMPWKTVWPNAELFRERDLQVYMVENFVVLAGFAILSLRAKGTWRTVYLNIFGAMLLYDLGLAVAYWGDNYGAVYPADLFDLPLIGSFLWLGTTGILARKLKPEPDPLPYPMQRDAQWPAQLAMLGVLSAPLLAMWTVFVSKTPPEVQRFRLLTTLIVLLIGTALVFFRQQLVYQERTGLVHELWESLENVKRLQTHFVQSEKLASLGQLAAGAAHEINNPLTAILGYSDLLIEEHPAQTRAHTLGEKIRDQARRTKDLVTNLLSFARQVPVEKQLLDLNTVLTGAVQLRNLDLREKNIRIELESRSVLPAVRGDPNQLLQVFYHLISNAVDAMETTGGGVLLIRTLREKGNVVVEVSDTGPGMKEPDKVFDPFYTTKPVGKGTGLGLSICYGVMQEHGGRITGFNRAEGGCTFRLELPAVLAVFPQVATTPTAPINTR
ncbi:MAG TPA: HAMP domain-containing sensor histidine kinase [Candidatus Limnocylindria bacterium]|nr:HAMP domain-containing sensor histidine kinase [Candidatus Limnocylindria bacterium]